MPRLRMPALLDHLHRSDPVFGGTGLAIGSVLVLALYFLVSPEDRREARGPFGLLAGHVALSALLVLIPAGHGSEKLIKWGASAFLLASLGRSIFLLFVNSFWIRRFARPLPKIFRDVIQAFIFAAVALLLLRAAGVEPGSLLTTSALLTAVIGLSLQDTLGNLFAGLAIQAQRPFDVGHWIQFDTAPEHIGRVLEINWRATRIRTLSNVEITVPNGALARAPIVNYSAPSQLVRREVDIVAPYGASPEFIRQAFAQACEDVAGVEETPAPSIVVDGFTDRGISYTIRYYISDFEQHEPISSRVRERLWYAMARTGNDIPVPQRRVALTRGTSGAARKSRPTAQLVAGLEFFQALTPDEIDRLVQQCQRQTYGAGEHIVRTGDENREMFVIEAGSVRIESPGEGKRGAIAVLGPGDFFGEMSLMTGAARAADAVAEMETQVLVLDHASFAPVIESHPELAERISSVLADRKQRLEQLQGNATQTPAIQKRDQDEFLNRIKRFFSL